MWRAGEWVCYVGTVLIKWKNENCNSVWLTPFFLFSLSLLFFCSSTSTLCAQKKNVAYPRRTNEDVLLLHREWWNNGGQKIIPSLPAPVPAGLREKPNGAHEMSLLSPSLPPGIWTKQQQPHHHLPSPSNLIEWSMGLRWRADYSMMPLEEMKCLAAWIRLRSLPCVISYFQTAHREDRKKSKGGGGGEETLTETEVKRVNREKSVHWEEKKWRS